MIRTEQGRGAFVVSVESARSIDPDDALSKALSHISRARAALTARRSAASRSIWTRPTTPTTCLLQLWRSGSPGATSRPRRRNRHSQIDLRRWAAHARNLLDTIEAALNREAQEEGR